MKTLNDAEWSLLEKGKINKNYLFDCLQLLFARNIGDDIG